MQDPRLILLSTVALSLAAFAGVWGALLALGWWIIATPRRLPLERWRALLGAFLFVLLTAALVSLSGGDGLSYLFRISVVLLVATWAYGTRKGGEFLDMGSWALGDRAGFELGLVAEMAMGSLEVLDRDLSLLLLALRQKAGRVTLRALVPALGLLVRRELDRARELGDLLAVRGYRQGGSLCPRFRRGRWDGVAALSAVGIAMLALLL
jgi:energy-coupling factor transporter transmembrane protein EcfT